MSEMSEFYIGRADLKLRFDNRTAFNGKVFFKDELVYLISPFTNQCVDIRNHPEWVGSTICTFNLIVDAFTFINSVLCPYTIYQGDPKNSGLTAMKKEPVPIDPPIYQGNILEIIDIIEDFHLNYNLGSAVKHIIRSNKKEKIQELEKAIWHLQREIQSYDQ